MIDFRENILESEGGRFSSSRQPMIATATARETPIFAETNLDHHRLYEAGLCARAHKRPMVGDLGRSGGLLNQAGICNPGINSRPGHYSVLKTQDERDQNGRME
jgi:hypothetical protein